MVGRKESYGKFWFSKDLFYRWAVIVCDPQLGDYYRHQYHIANHRCSRLIKPKWKDHITVIRKELVRNSKTWAVYKDVNIVFFYDIDVKTDGLFYWLDIEFMSNIVSKTRELSGLPLKPLIPYHLTIGYTEEAESLMRLSTAIREECPVCGAGNTKNFIICGECGVTRSQMK